MCVIALGYLIMATSTPTGRRIRKHQVLAGCNGYNISPSLPVRSVIESSDMAGQGVTPLVKETDEDHSKPRHTHFDLRNSGGILLPFSRASVGTAGMHIHCKCTKRHVWITFS